LGGSPFPRRVPLQCRDAWLSQEVEYDAGFDAELYKWVADWVKDWPFRKVAYPGRSIDWATWDAMVAGKH